ncbi:MAG TPA: TlpA disulfide reductase family protein [bacterium]|nr:TlpA disulfide reductase family protein [bacterium]
MKTSSRVGFSLVACLILLALLSTCLLAAEGNPAKAAPNFTLTDVNTGKQVSLSDFKGKVVVIDFWATWCIPCRKALKFYEKLYREKRDEGLVIIAVSIDQREKKLRNYVSNHPISFNVLHDPDKTVMKKFKVFKVPTTYIVDRDGKIQSKYVGILEKVIEARVEELLK